MNANSKIIGAKGEEEVCKYLIRKGYTIIDRNFRCKQGEIDIIASKLNELIFIEVKTRRNIQFGYPCEAVGKTKQKHILNVAKYYMWRNNIIENYNIRFDVIEVYYSNNYHINHIQNCF